MLKIPRVRALDLRSPHIVRLEEIVNRHFQFEQKMAEMWDWPQVPAVAR